MPRSRIPCLLPLLLAACGGSEGEADAIPVLPLSELGAGPVVPQPEIVGLVRTPDIEDGVPRIDRRLPSGALITLVQIAAVPELVPHPTGFYLKIVEGRPPRLTALDWGGGPPPPALGEVPEADEEDFLAAWAALGEVPEGAIVVLFLDGEVTLGQTEPVLELLATRGVQTVLWGFAGVPAEALR